MPYFKRAAVYLAIGQVKKALPDLDKTVELKRDFHQVGIRVINPRRACAARVTVLGLCVCVCVCLCVCVSVTQHLTFHVFIRATNDTNPLGGG